MPRDAVIELRFDRFLLPRTAVRQSASLFSGSRDGRVFLEPDYDPVDRALRLRLPEGDLLQPGLLYRLELTVPGSDPASDGIRAFDGTPLEEGPLPLDLSFVTATAEPALGNEPAPPAAPSCEDIAALLRRAGCADCHAGATPPLGLGLDGPPALRAMVGRVARQTDRGPYPGRPLVNPARFGTGMPLVDAASPSTSYLLYKVLLADGAYDVEEGSCPAPGDCDPPGVAELGRLREGFVRGDPMPPPGARLVGGLGTLRALAAWIREGARCP
ncbi:MAG: hypothetical protein FJ104_15330 [Deltaproteobacteria bacterium]|nr:hypothetical protein [Deltaproteobacteria bacterium]